MADEAIDRLFIQIDGDSQKYNSSIDAAVAKTKLMQLKQKQLVSSLEKNEAQQRKTAKSINEATLKYGANSDKVKALTNRLSSLKNKEQSLGSQLSSVNKALNSQQKEFAQTATQVEKTQKSMSGFMKVIATAATGYAGKKFLEATIGGLAQFEQYETSFAVMLGDMSKAKQMMSELQNFATKTPFEMTDVTKAGTLLMNYGVEAKKLIPTMKNLGDLSQGQAEKLDRISLAYGQMLAKGKVTGEELRQITEAGVSLNKALADSIGVSTAEISKMIEKGQIGIPELNKAIENLTTGNGKFAGMMEKQSKTLIGMWSTTKDEISVIAREIGEDAFVEVKDGLSDMLSEINTMRNNGELSALAKNLGSMLSTLTKGFMGTTKVIIENKEAVGGLIMAYGAFKVIQQVAVMQRLYTTAVEASTVAQKAMNVVAYANPYVALAGALTAAIGAMVMFSNKADETKDRIKELNEEMDKLDSGNISGASDRLAELKMATEQTLPKIEQLSKIVNQTAGDKELLKRYVENLNTVLGYEAAVIEDVNGKLSVNTSEIYKNIEALENKAKADAVRDKMEAEYSKKIDAEIKLEDLKIRQIKAQEEYNKAFNIRQDEINRYINNPDSYDTLKKAQKALKGVNKEISSQESLIKTSDKYISKLTGVYDNLSTKISNTSDNITGFWQTVNSDKPEAFVSDLKGMSQTLQTLSSAQKEYKDSNNLSVKTLESLSKQYPKLSTKVNEYSAGLIDIKDLVGEFPSLYETEKQSYIDSMKAKLTGSEAFYKYNILSQAEQIKSYKTNYGIDLTNFKTLAQAKGKIESNLITTLSDYWAEYYNSVGGSATKTVNAMREQLRELKFAKNTLSISMDSNASKAINKQIADIEKMISALKPMQSLENIEFNVDFEGIESSFDDLLDKVSKVKDKASSSTKSATKKVEDILKDTYDKQLKIAKDYMSKRQKQIDDEYNYKVDRINKSYEDDKKALDNWYRYHKERIDYSIKAIDKLISAKNKAREDEKLDDNLSSTKKKISTLKTQITYSRSPQEKAELEKELARQQEELKELSVQKEVSELESQKKVHQDKLERLEKQYKAESEYIEYMRDKELETIEQAKDTALKGLEQTFTSFGDNLAATYGYVNDETLAIGQRFANATVGALEGGFNTVANKSKQVINSMISDVEKAINRMNSRVNSLGQRYLASQDRDSYSSHSYDNRSMNVTNNVTRGLTEGQVYNIVKRQADDFLYKRR